MSRTKQEIFDIAYRGLASQGFQQSRSGIGCAYRGDGGLKCAVGHLIPDERYHDGLEGLSSFDDGVMSAAGLPQAFESLLSDMQGAHDGEDIQVPVPADAMKASLADVAANHGLVVPQVAA